MRSRARKCLAVFSALAICALVPARIARADIYKYVDAYGRVYLTDRPEHGGYKRLVRTWKGWSQSRGAASINYRLLEANRRRFSESIARAARSRELPTALVHAVITAESAYDPNAVSSAGAVGLMQLMPQTAARYGVQDRRDPVANITGGTRYLRYLLGLFDNDLVLAIAAYNAGENAVIEHGRRIPPYEETQTYVKRVLKYYDDYRKMAL